MRRRPWCARLIVLGPMLALACGTDPGGFQWTGTRSTDNGTEVVRNRGPFLPPGAVSLRRLWRLPPAPIDLNDTTFHAPSQIRGDGRRIYVLDPMAARVTVLSWDGVIAGRIGRRGEGPGELRRPLDLLLDGTELGIIDRGAIRWHDASGLPTTTMRLPITMVISAWPLGNRVAMFGSPAGWHVGVPGDSLRLLFPPFPPSTLAPGWAPTECQRTATAAPVVLRARCTVLTVQILDTTGRLVREIAVADEPEIVSDDELARAEATMRATGLEQGMRPGLAAAHAEFRAQRMRERPRYRHVRGDPVWLIVWEQPPVELGDGEATVHVFTRAGVYFGAASPGEQWIDVDLHDGRVVALAREPVTGLAYVTAYRITVPPGALAAAAAALER